MVFTVMETSTVASNLSSSVLTNWILESCTWKEAAICTCLKSGTKQRDIRHQLFDVFVSSSTTFHHQEKGYSLQRPWPHLTRR